MKSKAIVLGLLASLLAASLVSCGSKSKTYTVTFKNYDASTLYTTTVNEGEDAVYKGVQPVKPSDTKNSYVFSGWDHALTSVLESFTTTAQYKAVDLGANDLTYEWRDDIKAYAVKKAEIKDDATTITISGTYDDGTHGKADVKVIGDSAFFGLDEVKHVVIPSSVTTIEKKAFSNCSGLLDIDIPSSVTAIGDKAFYTCPLIKSFSLSKNLSSLGEAAFASCQNLASFVVEAGSTILMTDGKGLYLLDGTNKTLVAYASANGDAYTVSEGTTAIADYACAYASLSSITIPSGVKSIGNWAFDSCQKLVWDTAKMFPSSLTTIGDYAFSNCTSLTDIELPETAKYVGAALFYQSSVKTAKFGSKITEIKERMFFSCPLESITINGNITFIGADAFHACELMEFSLPATISEIGASAFSECDKLETLNYASTKAKWAQVKLGANWKAQTFLSVVHCTDGDVTL
jgi:hypothetical protein